MIIVEIAGHLGADPEVSMTPNGHKRTVLRVATNIRTGDKDKDETLWWQATVWGTEFDNMIKHLRKGSAIWLFGEMPKLSTYTDKLGQQQVGYRMTVRMLKFSPFGKTERPQDQQQQPGSYPAPSGHSAHPQSNTATHNGFGGYGEHQAASAYGASAQHSQPAHAHDAQDDEAPPF